MTTTTTEPIAPHWTPEPSTGSRPYGTDEHEPASAAAVNRRLAMLDVSDIGVDLVPHLAAAAAELGLLADIPWRFSVDDPPVALLRMIAKVALRRPDVGGPHTERLLEQLS